MRVCRIDWSGHHPQPSTVTLAVATIMSVAGSLAVDALLVFVGTSMFPATVGYAHFRFSDYATLTIIGVLIACAAWPIVTRISSAPRWLFLRLALAVTLVLWLPDVYLLIRNQPVRAIAVLMVMHLAVAVVTFTILVRIAPAREASAPAADLVAPAFERTESSAVPRKPVPTDPGGDPGRSTSHLPTALALLVGVEFVSGIAALVALPTGRPSGWLPPSGTTIYLAHATLGVPLALGAVVLLVRVRGSTRIPLLSGWIGCIGVAVAGMGGLLTAAHPLRLVGMACMLVGPVVAGFGYLLPTLDRLTDDSRLTEDG
ncbi:MAG: hypothetical protein ACLPR9_17005 [Acidimicrobiales bacterium]